MCAENEVKYNFFVLLMQIPVINTGLRIGTKVYNDIKKCNPFVESTLQTTEHTIDYLKKSETVAKLSQKLVKPLMLADVLACNGLKVVETKYPFILVAPQDFKVEAMKKMDDLKGYGNEKLVQLWSLADQHKDQALEKLCHYLDILVGSKVRVYVDLIDKKVDHYLPTDDTNADEESDSEDPNVFTRVSDLSSKIRNRISRRYHRLVLKVMWNHEA